MKKVFEIFYGFLIGIANIIPGASGGTVAVITGVYSKLIDSISNVLKAPFASFKNLIFIILGIVIGFVFGLFAISKLIEIAPIPTFFCFGGLIIGTIPFIFNKVKIKKKTPFSWLFLAIAFAIVIALGFLSAGVQKDLEFNLVNMLVMFFLGVVALIAMILPGVSGSMLVTSFGYYESLTTLAKDTLNDLLHFNFTTDILLLLSFSLGAVIGLLSFAKLIKFLLAKYFVTTFMSILGLVVASSITIIVFPLMNDEYAYQTSDIVIGMITLVVGIIAGYFLTKIEKVGETNE